MADSENIVAETAERIFADLADAQTINRDKKGSWKAPLWQALTEAGLPLSWVPEDCDGSGASLADASSKDFELRRGIVAVSVSSEVSVARTPATAASGLAAIRSAHVRGCFSRYLGLLLKGQHYGGATLGRVSIESGTPPAPGTAGGFGWRVTATLTTHRIRIPFYMDILGFVYGPARVTLFSSGALHPFPAAAEQRLFSLLLGRAKAGVP